MNVNTALNTIKNVCAIFRGTLQEHKAIQESIVILETNLHTKDESVNENEIRD